jgi:hypothetical protein
MTKKNKKSVSNLLIRALAGLAYTFPNLAKPCWTCHTVSDGVQGALLPVIPHQG